MRVRTARVDAQVDDIPAIVAMAGRFYPESGYTSIDTLDVEAVAGMVLQTIDSGVMLVVERDDGSLAGMACLHIEPFIFNLRTVIAQELVWWIDPEDRGGLAAARLLKACEDACRARGANVMRMAVLPTSPEAATRMLCRFGFRPSENYFVKELT